MRAGTGPVLSSVSNFSAMSSPPPDGSRAKTFASSARIFSSDQYPQFPKA
jgi:hypothetical protein